MIKKYDYDRCDGETIFVCTCKACGYVHESKWTKDGYATVKGDRPFIELGMTTKKGNDYFETLTTTQLYACPKCGTVHIEI